MLTEYIGLVRLTMKCVTRKSNRYIRFLVLKIIFNRHSGRMNWKSTLSTNVRYKTKNPHHLRDSCFSFSFSKTYFYEIGWANRRHCSYYSRTNKYQIQIRKSDFPVSKINENFHVIYKTSEYLLPVVFAMPIDDDWQLVLDSLLRFEWKIFAIFALIARTNDNISKCIQFVCFFLCRPYSATRYCMFWPLPTCNIQ